MRMALELHHQDQQGHNQGQFYHPGEHGPASHTQRHMPMPTASPARSRRRRGRRGLRQDVSAERPGEPWMLDPAAAPSDSLLLNRDELLARELQRQEQEESQARARQQWRQPPYARPYGRSMPYRPERTFQLHSGRQVISPAGPSRWEAMAAAAEEGYEGWGPSWVGHAAGQHGASAVGDSYEELLALDETVVKRGVSPLDLDRRTVTHALTAAAAASAGHCTVCLEDFAEQDVVRRLPCLCVYHPVCIDRHLLENTTCPICRLSVTDDPATLGPERH